MRLNSFFTSAQRVSSDPLSPTFTEAAATAAGTAVKQPLDYAPKTGKTQSAAKSRQGMLASARKSLATLRKQLPTMCFAPSITKPVKSQTPLATFVPYATKRDTEQRPSAPQTGGAGLWEAHPVIPGLRNRARMQAEASQQQSLATARTAERAQPGKAGAETQWHRQAPNLAGREQIKQPAPAQPRQATPEAQRQRQAPNPAGREQIKQPAPAQPRQASPEAQRQRQAPNLAGREHFRHPQPPAMPSRPEAAAGWAPPMPAQPARSKRLPAVRDMNVQLAALSAQCDRISRRLYAERRAPRAEEREVFDARATLIAERNAVRDEQLDKMLMAMAPLEKIEPPQTTTSWLAEVQGDVIQSNRHALLAVRNQDLDMTMMEVNYARAQRRLESFKEGGASPRKIRQLERMMQGYNNLLALEDIVKRTDDQLEQMGAPRVMDSIPTTPEARARDARLEREAQQEAMTNGYF